MRESIFPLLAKLKLVQNTPMMYPQVVVQYSRMLLAKAALSRKVSPWGSTVIPEGRSDP